METIAVINRKGGVGKTTTSINLAYNLSTRGYRTLLVDMDQQHNATDMFGARIDGAATVYDLMTDKAIDPARAVQVPDGVPEGFGIIAGDDLMNEIEAATAHTIMRDKMLVRSLRQLDGLFDCCIIDCPTALGLASTNALMAADDVLIPVLAGDECSVDGLRCLMMLVDAIASDPDCNQGLRVAGVFQTLYNRQLNAVAAVEEELAAACADLGIRLLDTPVRRCTKVAEASKARQALALYAPGCTAALDYGWLTDELVEQLSD